ncbi:putative aldehyde dehydrogenase [Aspergillus nomiae NRRL 13137]|uniref:Putative aldehyde dehydrogenase n=1 Tax=Aspergillus nomiae NRRL (strain ATCC 15546 / NRRL 13137 / CBS 260.88 / M93) TaxID=1509407 RepID=A0A0L1J0D0_ASPN3|nr:putative aldehyde dehydrogenase [Aspergillus nomiae NRRL 13137]KNG85202.1 putative aldehyde dehydrogenase [Aspergillus nomiae NRRL 13137]
MEVAGPTSHKASVLPLWLDGLEICTPSTFDVISPVTHEVLYQCSTASEADVSVAVESANRAFQTWSRTKPQEKRDIFLRAAEIFARRKDELFEYVSQETGEGHMFFDVEWDLIQQMCKDIAGLIQTIQGDHPTVAAPGHSALVVREPYGVVTAIAPWNAPYILGLRSCLLPLAAGNTVVLKGPETAPKSFWAIADTLYQAGLPPGCLNTLYHRQSDAAPITTALISHPLVQKINFTGSTAVGSIIASTAGKYLKPVLLELGGKASAIVCEDADLQLAAAECALGSFLNSGQICMSTERILVHDKVATRFTEALKAAVASLFHDQPAQMVNTASLNKSKRLIQDAISKGSRASRNDAVIPDGANKMHLTVLENVDPSMDIYHSESFGPSVSLITVTSDDEAIQIANDTEYGLTSAVFTEDLRRGFRIAKQIQSGAVHINSMTVHDETVLPHGGMKRSGFGRFNSREGLNEWVRTKSVTWKD